MAPMSPHLDSADRILEYTAVAANGLRDVATAAQIPFLPSLCTLCMMIIPMVQNAKFQKQRCLRIVEQVHHLLCTLLNLCIYYSEDIQSQEMLNQIAQSAVTLQKIDACLRTQQELGTIRRLFKQSEIIAQLDSCESELTTAVRIFTMKFRVGMSNALVELNVDTEMRHQQLLELVASQSDSNTLSSIGRSSLNASSGSLSLLPASPKIFHGRESELQDLVNILVTDSARVAILGPGGMGKTALAMAALHDPKVVDKYRSSYFISCDSAHTIDSLVAMIASTLGLEVSTGLTRAVVHHLSTGPTSMVVLDNFETPWEPVEGRAQVEEFLSLLTDVPHVALLLTMRGAERPSKVKWSHPFLGPLMPLAPNASRRIFVDIADDGHDQSEVDEILGITDNIPLAVQLVATIAASEGCRATLERWKLERTALLSAGYDRRSNLETSIQLSLSSPRMLSSPQAIELLSLMSLLSDGISDVDLLQSKLPIPDILHCKTTLVRTALAYLDNAARLKVLSPIREYIHIVRPPSSSLLQPVRHHLNGLLTLWTNVMDRPSFMVDLTPRLVANLGNLHNLLLQGLDSDHIDRAESMRGIIILNNLNLTMNHGLTPLMLRLPELLAETDDHQLHGLFITGAFRASEVYTIPNPAECIDQAIEHFRIIRDLDGEARFYNMIAGYQCDRLGDMTKAGDFYHRALSVASQCNSAGPQVQAFAGLASIEWRHGNYVDGLRLAREAHRIAVAAGNVWGECIGVRWEAVCSSALGDFKHCARLMAKGKELVQRAGFQGGRFENFIMNIEAGLYESKTEYAEARQIQEDILRKTSAELSPVQHAFAHANLAFLGIETSANTDIVSDHLDGAMTAFRNAQYPRGILACELFQADIVLRDGHTTSARTEYMRIFAAARNDDSELAISCLSKLADPTKPVHAVAETGRWAVVFLAFALHTSTRSLLTVHKALRCYGDILARQEADDEALSILELALDGLTHMDVHQCRAECMRTMGDVHFRRGEFSKAFALWKEARPLFERSLQTRSVSEIDDRLTGMEQHREDSLEQLSR